MIYDSKRDRLLYLLHDKETKTARLYERPIPEGSWRKLETSGAAAAPTREVAYDSVNDCLLALHSRRMMVIDCRSNTRKDLDVEFPGGKYGVAGALMYDPVHELCVALIPARRGRMQVVLFRYEPTTAKYK